MAETTISPNMGLPVPNVALAPGPEWAASLNACLAIIDQHNHTSGEGAPIPPDGFVISTDLSFGGYSATNMASILFTAQTSVSDTSALYVSGVDLYFNDGSGSPAIQMTSGGAVNATSSGITSGTNTASFVSNVLVVNTNSTTPADIQGGSIYLGNNTSNTKFLKLSPPAAMAANYTVTLIGQGAIPLSGSAAITIDSTGTMGTGFIAPVQIANNTINSGMIQAGVITLAKMANNSVGTANIVNDAVTTAKILDANVTNAKIEAVNFQQSSSTGSFTTSSLTYVDVTNLTVTITSIGKPVVIIMQPDASGNDAFITLTGSSTTVAGTGQFQLLIDGAANNNWRMVTLNTGGVPTLAIPPAVMIFLTPAAGAHTYKIQAKIGSFTTSLAVANTKLVGYELK